MKENTSTVVLRRNWSGDWFSDQHRMVLCGEEFSVAVHLPKRVEKITLVFTETRMAQSFKLRPNKGRLDSWQNPYKVSGNSNLTHSADSLISGNLAAGRSFVRVEYI